MVTKFIRSLFITLYRIIKYIFYSLPKKMLLKIYYRLFCWDKRHIRWFRQRLIRGFDDRELWCLSDRIEEFTLPRLKAFRNGVFDCPGNLVVDEEGERIKGADEGNVEWKEILDDIIFAFENNDMHIPDDVQYDEEKRKEWMERINKGYKYFGEYFNDLWY